MIYTADKVLKEYGSKIPEDAKKRIEDAKNALLDTMKGEDTAKIRSKIEELKKALEVVGTYMYQNKGASDDKKSDDKKGDSVDGTFKK